MLAQRLQETAQAYVQQKKDYVVIADMFGATPFNAALTGLAAMDATILTGVNLSMLLELLAQRQNYTDLDSLLDKVLDSAGDNIRRTKTRDVFKKLKPANEKPIGE